MNCNQPRSTNIFNATILSVDSVPFSVAWGQMMCSLCNDVSLRASPKYLKGCLVLHVEIS